MPEQLSYDVRTLLRFHVTEKNVDEFFDVAMPLVLNFSLFGCSLNFGAVAPYPDDLEEEVRKVKISEPYSEELLARLEEFARSSWGTDTAPTLPRRYWFGDTQTCTDMGIFFKCAGSAPGKWFAKYCDKLRSELEQANIGGDWYVSMSALDKDNNFTTLTYSSDLPEVVQHSGENGDVDTENRIVCSLRTT